MSDTAATTPPPAATARTKGPKRRRRAAAPARRVYHAQDQVRAAYLAGMGMSGKEIADAIGGTTSARVREMLRKCGIKMRRKSGAEDLLQIRWPRRDGARFVAIADRLDYDAPDLAAALLRVLIDEPTLLENLLDEDEED